MIENIQHRIKKRDIADGLSLAEAIERLVGPRALRWYIAQITADEIVVEATTCGVDFDLPVDPASGRYHPGRSAVLSVIPTGIGCAIGGYAGDAAPVTNLLASTVDYLVTHPNAVNASDFSGMNTDNIVYTDGFCVDMLCKGLVDLYVPYSNRVGLIVERSQSSELDNVYNIVNTARAVYGVNITDVLVTAQPIGGRCVKNKSGAFVGAIDNTKVLFEACEKLISSGVQAIAVTSNIRDLPLDGYASHFDGQAPNPVGGVEAVISYLITKRFQIPSAHAPLTNTRGLDLKHNVVDARAAGEMASASGLACVLIGLRRAPQTHPKPGCPIHDIINLNNLLAVVLPSSSAGGIPALYAQKHRIPIIAVRENQTILDVTPEKIRLNNVIEVRSYAEAAGVILALRRGISVESISRPLDTLR
jgi:hypothetical protein